MHREDDPLLHPVQPLDDPAKTFGPHVRLAMDGDEHEPPRLDAKALEHGRITLRDRREQIERIPHDVSRHVDASVHAL